MTRTGETGPLNRELGISNITPDKLNLATTWKFMPKASVTLEMDKLFKRDVNIGNPAGGAESTRGLTLFHLTASYSTKWGDFSLGVENLVNKFYILPYVQAGQVLGGDLAGRGRVFSVTHAIKF